MPRIQNGTRLYGAVQFAKFAVYRTPVLNRLLRPTYPYALEPAQLAWLVASIDATRSHGGSIVEVGVARGMTSAFLLRHMQLSGDPRPYYCLDTFTGFLDADVDHETTKRGKARRLYGDFAYNDIDIFRRNLASLTFSNFTAIQCDASRFDWSTIPMIDVMLLDVDLYLPTLSVLRNSAPRLNLGARVLVDDVKPGKEWDGAYQAYNEFCIESGRTPIQVGRKGGAVFADAK